MELDAGVVTWIGLLGSLRLDEVLEAATRDGLRDLLLQRGVIGVLLRALDSTDVVMVRKSTEMLVNLFKVDPRPSFLEMRPTLPALVQLTSSQDVETVNFACLALAYIAEGSPEGIQGIIDTNVAVHLIGLLGTEHRVHALRVLGMLLMGDDAQTQWVLDLGALPAIVGLLNTPELLLCKLACQAISNVAAGTVEQVQMVIDVGALPVLVNLMWRAHPDIQREVAWIFSNVTSYGNMRQISQLVEAGVVQSLCNLLVVENSNAIYQTLEALENILSCGKTLGVDNGWLDLVIACGGAEGIRAQVGHENQMIATRALRIVKEFLLSD